jgi:hypothetical protein
MYTVCKCFYAYLTWRWPMWVKTCFLNKHQNLVVLTVIIYSYHMTTHWDVHLKKTRTFTGCKVGEDCDSSVCVWMCSCARTCMYTCACMRMCHHNNLSCHVCGLDGGNRISGYKIFRGHDHRISQSLHLTNKLLAVLYEAWDSDSSATADSVFWVDTMSLGE